MLHMFLYICLIHVKGMQTKKNNDKINKKKKHEENYKIRTPKNENKKKN